MSKADVFGLNPDICKSARMWELELLCKHLYEQKASYAYWKFDSRVGSLEFGLKFVIVEFRANFDDFGCNFSNSVKPHVCKLEPICSEEG